MREKMDLSEIREALAGRHVATIARDTKLSRQTIYTALKDVNAKPSNATLKLLSDWIALDAKRAAAKSRMRKV